MHPYSYRIRFLFIHPNLDFSAARNALSAISGFKPGIISTAGQDRFTPKGTKLEGTYRDSRWSFDLNTSNEWQKSEDKVLSQALNELVAVLEPYKNVLEDLFEKGCELEIVVAWDVANNVGEIFESRLLMQLSDLHLSLCFDLPRGRIIRY